MTIAQTGKTDNSDMYNQTICHVNWSKIFIPIIWMGLRISTFGAFLMRKQSWTIDAWFWKTLQKKPLPIPFFERRDINSAQCAVSPVWSWKEKRNLFDNMLNMILRGKKEIFLTILWTCHLVIEILENVFQTSPCFWSWLFSQTNFFDMIYFKLTIFLQCNFIDLILKHEAANFFTHFVSYLSQDLMLRKKSNDIVLFETRFNVKNHLFCFILTNPWNQIRFAVTKLYEWKEAWQFFKQKPVIQKVNCLSV